MSGPLKFAQKGKINILSETIHNPSKSNLMMSLYILEALLTEN